MHGIRHPFTQALYERDGDGNVLVTNGDRQGLFTAEGRWLSGELRECDPQLCGWVAGPQMLNHRMSSQPSADDQGPTSSERRDG